MHGTDGKLYQINSTVRSVRKWMPCGSSQEHIDNLLVATRLWFRPGADVDHEQLLSPAALQFLRSVVKTSTTGFYDCQVAYDLSAGQYVITGYVVKKDAAAFASRTMSHFGCRPLKWQDLEISLTSMA